MKLSELYETRRDLWRKTTIRYVRLIANSGFMFTLYVAIIIGGVYYQRALTRLPEHFPSALLLTCLFGAVVIPTSVRTFIQKADLIFLLPAEHDLSTYFRKAIRDSWVKQSVVIVFVAVLAMPLYLKTLDTSTIHFGGIVLLLILLKGWNLYGLWCEGHQGGILGYKWARGLFSLVFIYLILVKASWLFIGVMLLILIALSVFGYRPMLIQSSLDWIGLAEQEGRQAARFLRRANWVTDVPGLVHPVKPRRYLNVLLKPWGKGKRQVYPLLYMKTFQRSGDYFGLVCRLTLIAALLMVLVRHSEILTFVIYGLSLFLANFQLLSLAKHDFPQSLEGLYPLTSIEKRKGFVQVIRLIALSQSVFLTLVYFATHIAILPSLLMLLIGGGGAVLWINGRSTSEKRLPLTK